MRQKGRSTGRGWGHCFSAGAMRAARLFRQFSSKDGAGWGAVRYGPPYASRPDMQGPRWVANELTGPGAGRISLGD
jgi:hypothetical protein